MDVFRDALTRLMLPVGHALAALRLHPHVLSMSGILLGCASAYFFVRRDFVPAMAFFIVSGLADSVDGIVARRRGLASPFGSFFDNFCSLYTDSAVFIGLVVAGLCDPLWGVAALVGSLARLFTFRLDGLVPEHEGQSLRSRFPHALAGKGDRILLIGLGTVFGRINEAMIVIAIASNAIAAYRSYHLYRWEMAGARGAK
jgi:hypothetical protein